MILKTLLGGAAVLAMAGPARAADPAAALGWMQGCWAAGGTEAGSGEQWMAAAGGTMLGMSRTIKAGKTVEFEFMQIREVAPGKLAFMTQPSGRAPTTFALLRQDGKEFVFENLEHDFPQRVIYRRDGERGLAARIEGVVKGKAKGIDFPFSRVRCDAD